MSLGIKRIRITAMQRMIIEILPAAVEPLHYTVVLLRQGESVPYSEDFTGRMYRSPQLYAPEQYEVAITAVYADPGDNEVYAHPDDVTVTQNESMATILRQAIWDICYNGSIAVDERLLYAISDGWYRPAVLRKNEVPGMPKPCIEVGMPVLRNTAFQTDVRETEEWRIPMRMLDAINKDDPDDFGRVWRLCEQVKRSVNLTANLGLGGRGVLDKAWSWRVMEDPDPERDRMSGLRLWLTVFVQREIGAVGA